MDESAPSPIWLSRVATLSQRAGDVDELVEGLLEVLQDLTGLDSTYLTRIHWDRDVQEVLRSLNTGELQLTEGLLVPWGDTLCRRALDEDTNWVDDVPDRWGDSDAARELGIQTYVSTPVVVRPGSRPWGTLCGASSDRVAGDENVQAMLRLFAHLISDAIERQQAVEEQQERADRAEARLATRTQLTAAAEHALKGPAASVRMWAETLLSRWTDLDDDARRDGISHIRDAAERMLAQVSDLVREARADLLAGSTERRPVDLAELARTVADHLGTEHHRVVVVGALTATTDPDALSLALEHLVDNTRAHTPPGTTVTITLGPVDGTPTIVVRDDGPGLPDGIDVFAPFVRGNLDNEVGTGLGLHIVRTFVEAVGGTVEAHNDGGAVFTLVLPAD